MYYRAYRPRRRRPTGSRAAPWPSPVQAATDPSPRPRTASGRAPPRGSSDRRTDPGSAWLFLPATAVPLVAIGSTHVSHLISTLAGVMALTATLYTVATEISDVDRGVYVTE